MAYPLSHQIRALPTYFGGKRRLLSWLGQVLSKACPPSSWHQMRFIDLFMGGGAVSYWAKAQGFLTVTSNDISYRSQILAEALLQNHHVRISRSEALLLTQSLPEEPGSIEAAFCPSVFASHHARALDQGFYRARQHPDPTKRALLLTILWHLANDFVAFPTSLGTSNRPYAEALDGLRGWDDINPKRFNDGSLKRLCEPAWSHLEEKRLLVNSGVLGGSPVTHYCEDAMSLLPTLTGDILYLDPPYSGTVSYERGNLVLDQLLTGEVSASPVTVSPFSKSAEMLSSLLSQADHIPVWLLSYGNTQMELPELVTLVSAQAHGRKVVGYSRGYTHLSHVSQNPNHRELLVLAYKEDKDATH